MSDDLKTLFREGNNGSNWYMKHKTELIKLMRSDYCTLPIAAAYNEGYDEAMKKVRNNKCHTLQTKKD